MPNKKFDSVTLAGSTETYDVNLPESATPKIISLETTGNITVGGSLSAASDISAKNITGANLNSTGISYLNGLQVVNPIIAKGGFQKSSSSSTFVLPDRDTNGTIAIAEDVKTTTDKLASDISDIKTKTDAIDKKICKHRHVFNDLYLDWTLETSSLRVTVNGYLDEFSSTMNDKQILGGELRVKFYNEDDIIRGQAYTLTIRGLLKQIEEATDIKFSYYPGTGSYNPTTYLNNICKCSITSYKQNVSETYPEYPGSDLFYLPTELAGMTKSLGKSRTGFLDMTILPNVSTTGWISYGSVLHDGSTDYTTMQPPLALKELSVTQKQNLGLAGKTNWTFDDLILWKCDANDPTSSADITSEVVQAELTIKFN